MATPMQAAQLFVTINAHTGTAEGKITKFDAKMKKSAAIANTASNSVGKAGSAMAQRAATAAKYGALGLAGLGAASVAAATKFESSFAEVRKTTDASEAGFKKLEGGIRNLAKAIPVSANELADLAGEAGALGIKSKDLIGFTKTAAELGVATDLSANDAANALARLSNIMGTSSKDFRRLGSTFVQLGNKGASTESEIAAMALRIAGAGKQIGLTEPEVLGFASALSSVGIEAEAGGSSISRAFITMQEAVNSGGAKLAAFAKVSGVSSAQFSKGFKVDAAGAMVAFIEGLDRVRKSGGNVFGILEGLSLKEIRVRDALLRAAGAGDLFHQQLKIGSQEWKRNSALTQEANRRYETTAAQFQLLKNRANDLLISLGQKLLPGLKELMEILGDPKLTFGEKVDRVMEMATDAFSRGLTVLAQQASQSGPKVVGALAKGMLRGWSQLNPLGKLLATGAIIRIVGGKGAVVGTGAALGRWLGIGIGAGAATGIAGGAGGAAAGGAAGGILGALKGVRWARIGGLGIGIALADATINEFALRAKAKSDDLGEALEGASGLGIWATLDKVPVIGALPILKDEEKAARNLSAQYEEMAEKRVRISLATEESLRKQAAELHLSKKTTQQLSGMLDLMRTGRDLGLKVDLGMDPGKLSQALDNFATLRSGVLTSMGDIAKVTQRNAQIISTQLPKGSKEARDKLAENFRAAAAAVGKAMANGDISIKQGLARQRALFRSAHLVSGDDPLGIAKGFASSWEKAEGISNQRQRQMIADLGKMPPAARQKAFDAMVNYGRGLVKGGKIPLDDLRDFRSKALSQLDTLKSQGGRKADAFAGRVSGSFVDLAGSVREALENIGINVDAMLSKLGAAKASKFQLKKFTQSLPQLKPLERQKGGAIVPGAGSGDKVQSVLPAGSFILNREATKAFGLAKGGMMPVALEPGERRFLPAEVAAIGARNLEAMNRSVPRFQRGGQLGKPVLAGPEGPLLDIGRGAVDKVYKGAKAYLDKHQPVGGVGGAAFGPKGVGSYKGVPMANWVIEALQYAASKGAAPQPTSGYRSHAYNVSQGRDYKSEHEGTQYPYGAVDFGGYSTGLAAKMAVVNATKNFKYPLLAPIGFKDDGHASGTGHQLGGMVKALQRLAKGGSVDWVHGSSKLGADQLATLAHYVGMSNPGLMSQIAQAESGGDPTVTNSIGARGLWQIIPSTAKAFGLNYGNLTDPLANARGAAEVLSEQGLGAWEAYENGSYSSFSKGTVSGSLGAAGGGDKTEDVPAVYRGARTGSLSFGSIPKSLSGIEKELHKRRGEAKTYRAAVADASKKGKSKVEQALTENLRELEGRIRELERARAKERREAAKRKITKRFSKALGALTGFEDLIAAKERTFDEKSQFAEQLVDLEPVMPEISEKATNAQREAIEGKHVADLTRYIWMQEQPAYQALLSSAGEWRNTILSGQEKAAGNWQKGKTLGGLEGNWEDKIIATGNEIEQINDFKEKVADRVATWRKKHGNDPFPDWLREQVKKDHQERARLPVLRFREQELRKVLGEGRERFYPGKARIQHPPPPYPGSGSFEEALQNVQGIHWPAQHEKIASLPANRIAGAFGGVIWDVQSSIAELGMKIRDAVAGGGGGTAEEAGDSERLAFVEEQLRHANQRNLVFQRQKPLIDAYESKLGFAGMFAKGGSIPAGMWGIAGERGPEPVIGPATVVSNQDAQGVFSAGATTPLDIRLIVEDGAVDESKIKVIANGEAIKVTKQQGRGARSIGSRRAGRLG